METCPLHYEFFEGTAPSVNNPTRVSVPEQTRGLSAPFTAAFSPAWMAEPLAVGRMPRSQPPVTNAEGEVWRRCEFWEGRLQARWGETKKNTRLATAAPSEN